jgi:hypothetical protein
MASFSDLFVTGVTSADPTGILGAGVALGNVFLGTESTPSQYGEFFTKVPNNPLSKILTKGKLATIGNRIINGAKTAYQQDLASRPAAQQQVLEQQQRNASNIKQLALYAALIVAAILLIKRIF